MRAPAQRQLAQQQRLSKLQGRAAAAAANRTARRPEADLFPPISGGVRSAGSSRAVSPGPVGGPAAADLPASNGASPAAPSSSAREVFPALGPPTAAARQPNLRSWGPGEGSSSHRQVLSVMADGNMIAVHDLPPCPTWILRLCCRPDRLCFSSQAPVLCGQAKLLW